MPFFLQEHELSHNFAQIINQCAMTDITKVPSFNKIIEESVRKNWDLDSMSDYGVCTFQYKDVARIIEKMHILFEHAGIQKGDRIAPVSYTHLTLPTT